MINLDLLKENTIDFMIDGKLVKVQEPSIEMVEKFSTAGESGEGLSGEVAVITEILNNNTSSVKFTQAKVKKFSPSMLKAIVTAILGTIKSVEENPN